MTISPKFIFLTCLWCSCFFIKQLLRRNYQYFHQVSPFNALLADIYWLRMCSIDHSNGNWLWEYADYITDLDPYFVIVYKYGALKLLTHNYPKKALLLLQKANRMLPPSTDWQINFLGAYISSFALHDAIMTHNFLNGISDTFLTKDIFYNKQCVGVPDFIKQWQSRMASQIVSKNMN